MHLYITIEIKNKYASNILFTYNNILLNDVPQYCIIN
jgi:hypothetical protein